MNDTFVIYLYNSCLDDKSPIHQFQSQISKLSINFCDSEYSRRQDIYETMLPHIFIIFTNLQSLDLHPTHLNTAVWLRNLSPTTMSSSLLELHIYTNSRSDCLSILDGRFDQLRAFYVVLRRCGYEDPRKVNTVDYFN